MTRRVVLAAGLAALVLSGLLTTGVSAAGPTLPLPASMAAVGDSITQAASTGGSLGVDYPQNSWATGTSATVNSHYLRLLDLGAPISGENHNLSVSGARMADLDAQMAAAAAIDPDYLTVLIGGNDVCTDTVAEMTSVATFRAQFETAMATLTAGSPDTSVYVASIPDVNQLWSLFKGNFWARFVWSAGDICQSLLANPTSTQGVDVQRRQTVRQRNIDFNTQLAEVCAQYPTSCHFDGNAVFNTQFTSGDVSGDCFHPSVAGQAKLATVTWAAGYAWSASPPPPDRPMWIESMSATTTSGRTWTATVVIAVTDGTDSVPGVVVTGTWSAGSGATTCTTGSDGTCAVKSSNLNKKTTSVRFTVTSLAAPGLVYQPSSNVVSSWLVNKP
ncbi:MAG: GDSL-type esterase/lipase family protein [Chloroflexi bacterium]|nr:GDSL-type esterase/lipase family protein [Chloroflexota bacterium]